MENELKKRAKFHRKRQKGLPALSTLNPNAGNVEYNVAMFNKMNTPAGGFTNNPISGPMGGDVSAGSMGESVSMNKEWMLIKNSKWYDPEGLGIEPKGEIICSGTEEECRKVFSEFVIKARQKDRLYREQAIKGHHRPMMQIENLDAYSLVLSYPNAQAKDVYQLVQKKDNTVTETLNESAMTREQMISELQKAGKRYYFAKYTDGQIYNMYMKYVVNAPKAVDDTVSVEQEPEVFEEKPTCPDCGTRLTDGGYCPKCDDGEEDIMEDVISDEDILRNHGYRQDNLKDTFEIGDRVAHRWADIYNVGTIIDKNLDEDGLHFQVKWDYSDGPDIEWLYEDEITHWVDVTESLDNSSDVFYLSLYNKDGSNFEQSFSTYKEAQTEAKFAMVHNPYVTEYIIYDSNWKKLYHRNKRKVLFDANKELTEGNNVSSQLTPALDFFLQDIAQIHGTINYNDIMNHKYTEEDIKKLRNLRKQWREEAQYDSDETDTILSDIADEVASILKVSALEEGCHDPYWTPYGYRAAAKVITGSAPEYYYHLKEIEMDTGDGVKLAKYAVKKGLPVMVDIKSDPDYPEFYLKDGSNEYHWNDYFYPYGTSHLASKDYVPYTGQDLNTLYNDIEAAKVATYDDDFDMSTRSLL